MGLRDVLDHDRDIIIPCSDGLIVRRRYKPTIFVDKRDRVDRAQVLIIFLGDLSRVHVILVAASITSIIDQDRRKTNLNYLFVRHTSEENMLFVFVRVEAHDIGSLAITKPLETLAGLSIPQFHLAIITT
jgi:hypothetical protein